MKGKYGAYNRVSPGGLDVGNILANHENQQFKHNAERRTEEDRAALKLEKERSAKEQDGKDLEKGLNKMHVDRTGFKSHDEPLMKILNDKNGVFDTYSSVMSQLKKDPSDYKLLAKKVQLEKSIESLKTLRTGIITRGQQIKKGLESGALSSTLNKGYIENYDRMVGEYQYEYKLNDDGSLSVLNLGKFDSNQDGLPDEITIESLYDVTKLGDFKKKFNPDNWLKSTRESYGKLTEVKDLNGFVRKEFAGFDPSKIDALNNDIDLLFGPNANAMTTEAKSYIGDTLGLDPDTFKGREADFVNLKTQFKQKVLNAFETTNKTTKNYSAENSAENISLSKQREKRIQEESTHKLEQEKKNQEEDFKLQADTNEKGQLIRSKNSNGDPSIRYKGFKPFTVNAGGKTIQIQSLSLSNKGDISFSGVDLDVKKKLASAKTSKEKKEAEDLKLNIESFDSDVISAIASQLKFKDAKEMFDEMTKNKDSKIKSLKQDTKKSRLSKLPD